MGYIGVITYLLTFTNFLGHPSKQVDRAMIDSQVFSGSVKRGSDRGSDFFDPIFLFFHDDFSTHLFDSRKKEKPNKEGDILLRELQHTPGSHNPGILKPPNEKNFLINCWLRVWGMFKGYVGKFLQYC